MDPILLAGRVPRKEYRIRNRVHTVLAAAQQRHKGDMANHKDMLI